MGELAPNTISAFRSAADLNSSDTAQLRKTIEELQTRIAEQDTIMEQQAQAIINLRKTLQEKDEILQMLERDASQLKPVTDNLETLRRKKQEEDFKKLEAQVDEMEDGFFHVYTSMDDNLEEALKALAELPATSESTAIYARAKKEIQEIKRAERANKISPVNSLRLLADVEHRIVNFITARPPLTFTKAERYRAEFLIEVLERDPKLKAIKSPEAAKILSAAEEKPISTKQARRAMISAAKLHPEKVKLSKRGLGAGKSWKLCKIGNKEADSS